MRIFTVLKSGREYLPLHVRALKRQIEQHSATPHEFVCLTDIPVAGVECIRLDHDWPGWWAKMELFRPDLRGSILYFDLDTVITGSIEPLCQVAGLTLLRDFYRDGAPGHQPEGLGSGLMLLPEADRMTPWLSFSRNPKLLMNQFPGGDQRFLEMHYQHRAARWQDLVPGVVSWKVHCAQRGTVPKAAAVVCFHGQPRPWAVPRFQNLYQEAAP
jgi:hypothetical protein